MYCSSKSNVEIFSDYGAALSVHMSVLRLYFYGHSIVRTSHNYMYNSCIYCSNSMYMYVIICMTPLSYTAIVLEWVVKDTYHCRLNRLQKQPSI